MKAIVLLVLLLLQGGFSSWGQSWFYYCAEDAPLTEQYLAACDSSRGSIVTVVHLGKEVRTNLTLAVDKEGAMDFIYEGHSIGGMGLKAKEISQEKSQAPLSTFGKGFYYILTGARDSIQELFTVGDSVIDSYRQGAHARYKKVKGRITLETYEVYLDDSSFLWLWYDSADKAYASHSGKINDTNSFTTVMMPPKTAGRIGSEWGILRELQQDKTIWEGTYSNGSESRELYCLGQNECYVSSQKISQEGDTISERARLSRNKKGEFIRDFSGRDTQVVIVRQIDHGTDVQAVYLIIPDPEETLNWRVSSLSPYAQHLPVSVLTTMEGVEVSGKCGPCTKNKCDIESDSFFLCSYSDRDKKVWGSFRGYLPALLYSDNPEDSTLPIDKHGKTSEGVYKGGVKVGF